MTATIAQVQDDLLTWMDGLREVFGKIDPGRGRRIVCEMMPDYARMEGRIADDLPYARFRLEYWEPDNEDPEGPPQLQATRWWYVEPHMNAEAIIKCVWLATAVSDEHQRREWFRVAGDTLFSPHRSLK